jgi:PTH1 family peptidyl-tRNA hydrolase
MTRLIVGLGNPGQDYAGTRHNAGFEVLDYLARERGAELFRSARQLTVRQDPPKGLPDGMPEPSPGPFLWTYLADLDALLVQPQTFMNHSGRAVACLARWLWPSQFPITDAGGDPESAAPGYPDLMVVYDDLDLPSAQLRIRPHGGTGGHNGVRSITEHLSTDLFPRLKVGIGREGTDAARYVLQPFSASQREEIEVAYAQAAEALLDWLAHGDLEACMTRFHSRWNQDT